MIEPLALLATLVLADSRRWGAVAHGTQWEDARAVLDPTTSPYHYLTRARGWSKTTDLAAIAIVAMLTQLAPGSRLYALAADRDQGALLLDAVRGFVARTPLLREALRVESYRAIALVRGTILEVLPADASSAYGLRPDFLVIDELAQWPETPGAQRLWEATSTAMAKVPGARMVVLTSAGDPGHWSYDILTHARTDPLWRVHEVPGPPPWVDPERLAEQRRRLPPSSYQRLYLNEWTAAEDRLATKEALTACVQFDGPLPPEDGFDYVVAVDVGLVADRTAVAVCHLEPVLVDHADEPVGFGVVLDDLRVWEGSHERPVALNGVQQHVRDVSARYHRAEVVLDPWQTAAMGQSLRADGIAVTEFSFTSSSAGNLGLLLYRLIQDTNLALPEDPELLAELASVRLRPSGPGLLRLDHDRGRHDDRAVALAMAAHRLLDRPLPRRARLIV